MDKSLPLKVTVACVLMAISAIATAAGPSVPGRDSSGRGSVPGHGHGHTSPGIPGLPSSALPSGGRGGVSPGGGGGCPPDCGNQVFLPPVPVYELEDQKRQLEGLLALLALTKAAHDQLSRARQIDTAINILTAHWAIAVPGLRDQYQRTQLVYRTASDLKALTTKVLEATIEKMVVDVNRLKPFWWESSASASEKREILRQTEKELKDLSSWGYAEIYGRSFDDAPQHDTRRYTDAGGKPVIEYRPGLAMQQLKKIHETKCWESAKRCPK